MTPEGTKRKLAAILSADVKEYSRLMSQDERGTIRTLTAYKEAISSLVEEYKGRVVDAPGDNLLAEFGSVLDAVNCAVEIQRELAERNAELPRARQMEFRIGINLGDIVVEEKRIYGDGVNIAARVESLAEGGGICIAGTVHEQVKHRIGLEFEYLGEQAVKNIPEPVHVYRVLSLPGAVAHRVAKAKSAMERKWRKTAIAVALVLIVGGAAVGVWNFYFRTSFEPASKRDIEAFWKTEWLPLPEKPSIAVLPFDNLGDPKDDYFSDGLAEDIITDLAKISGMLVIARHSSFRYKGKPVDVQRVGRELGVRYLLEGSARKVGNRVRINAQLVNAVNGNHLWSERYDLEQKDLFNVQNEILKKIVTAIDVKLIEGEQAKLYRKATSNPEAYNAFIKGFNLFRQFRKDANSLARQYLSRAIELDPKYAAAIGMLGNTHWADARFGWNASRPQSIQKGKELALKAIGIDEKGYFGLSALSLIHLLEKDYERSMEARERAYSNRPNGADSNALMAFTLSLVSREKEALPYIRTAMRLSPFYPPWYLSTLCDIFRLMGRHDEAMATAKAIIELNLPHEIESGRLYLAAILIELGRDEEAREVAAEYRKLRPTFSLKWFKKTRIYKDPKVTETLINQLRKAGFPD